MESYRRAWTACDRHYDLPAATCPDCVAATITQLMDLLDIVQASNDRIMRLICGVDRP